MSQNETKVKVKRRMNPLKIILIFVFLLLLTQFGRLKSFAGSFIGQTGEDGSMVYAGADDWNGSSRKVTIGDPAREVSVPDRTSYVFDSEVIKQPLDIGNPSSNELSMKVTMMMEGQVIFETGILNPGKGFTEGPIKAIFEPNEYKADLVYTFYEEGTGFRKKLMIVGTYTQPITVTAEGSGERYRENIARSKKKDKG